MKYVGARYMPKFLGTYDNTTAYEALSVVDNGMGTSYVSNKPVPAGTPLTDTDYWAVYGMSSGAILNLQQQIDDMNDGDVPGSLQAQINNNASDITAIANKIIIKKALFSDVYDDTSLIEGDIVHTTNYSSASDKGGAYYKISATEESPYSKVLDNGLYAVLIPIDGYYNAIALGAKDSPSIIATLTGIPLTLNGDTIEITSDLNVGSIKNGTIKTTNCGLVCDVFGSVIEDLYIEPLSSNANTIELAVTNQYITVKNCKIGDYQTRNGIMLGITSAHLGGGLTYNCIFENLEINGGDYGIRFYGTDEAVTQCIFNDIRFNYTGVSVISAAAGSPMVAQHSFNNIVFNTQPDVKCIDVRRMFDCVFNNVTNYNDGANGTTIYPVHDDGDYSADYYSQFSIAPRNYFNNCVFEGSALGGKTILRNIFKNCSLRNTAINEVERACDFGIEKNNLLAMGDLEYITSAQLDFERTGNGLIIRNIGTAESAIIAIMNATLQKCVSKGLILVTILATPTTSALKYKFSGVGFWSDPASITLANGDKLYYMFFSGAYIDDYVVRDQYDIQWLWQSQAGEHLTIKSINVTDRFYNYASLGICGTMGSVLS